MYQKNNGFLVSAILTVYSEILTIDKAIKPNVRCFVGWQARAWLIDWLGKWSIWKKSFMFVELHLCRKHSRYVGTNLPRCQNRTCDGWLRSANATTVLSWLVIWFDEVLDPRRLNEPWMNAGPFPAAVVHWLMEWWLFLQLFAVFKSPNRSNGGRIEIVLAFV